MTDQTQLSGTLVNTENTAHANALPTPKKLFNKNYVLLWQGQFVSRLGNVLYIFAITAWITYRLNSPSLLGLLGMISGIPAILFGIIAGTVADNHSRKMIIVITDLLNGFFVLILAGLFFFLPETLSGRNEFLISGIFMVGITSATLNAFFGPAIDASIPDIVPTKLLAQANSMGQLSRNLARFIGQGLGAALISILGAPVFILINGFSFIFSGISEMFMNIPQHLPEKSKNAGELIRKYKADIKEGFVYIWDRKGLKRLVLLSILLGFFSAPVMMLLSFYVKDVLLKPERWFGFLLISYGIGSLVGYIFVALIRMRGDTRGRIIVSFMVAQALGFAALGLVNKPLHAIILTFIGGILNGFILVNIQTIIQTTVPSEIRGRVMGLLTTISASALPLGQGISGYLGEVLSIQVIYIASGLIMAVLIVLVTSNRYFKKFISYETKEEIEASGFSYNIRALEEHEMPLEDYIRYNDFI